MTFAKAVFLAARPKTLPAAIAPVLLGTACATLAAHAFSPLPAIFAALFALFSQIACNLANDYGDFKKGADTQARIGPQRATSQGWLSPQQTLLAALTSVLVAVACGLGLVQYGGLPMIAVGAISVVACLAYTLGPFPLAYHGLGDVFVVVFFGFVAVAFTAFTQCGEFPQFMWVVALACGLGADNILLINNLRDRQTDSAAGKRTTVVIFGEAFGKNLYRFNVAVMFLSPLVLRYFFRFESLCILLPMVVLPLLMPGLLSPLKNFKAPAELNPLLGKSAQFLLAYALAQSIGLFVQFGLVAKG